MATGGQEEVSCRLVRVRSMELRNNIATSNYSCLVVSENMIMVGEDNMRTVQLNRRQDGMLLAKTDNLTSRPCGICIINQKEICVILSNSLIEIMSVQSTSNRGVISKVRTILACTPFDSCHAAVKFMDNVVVSGLKQGTLFWCIVSLNDGHVETIHEICKGNLSFLTIKENIIYISCLAGLNSPEENTGVYAYDIQNPSKEKFVYKHYDLKDPKGITVDTRGFIFVCNASIPVCIHHLTDRCDLVTIYKEGMPSTIRAIFWDHHEGHLYVTCHWINTIIQYRPEYSHDQGEHTAPEIQLIYERKQPVIEGLPRQIEQRYEKEMEKDEPIETLEEVLSFSPVGSTESSETDGEGLPLEILKMDESFQNLYREALAFGEEEVYNFRVMIVGHQGVGKTSLTQRLLGEVVKEYETQPTEGIEVHAKCCQIDHASSEWKRKRKTDELSLNDLRIVNILSKYKSPQSNQDIKPTDPLNGIPPSKKPRLSMPDPAALPSPLDGGTGSILNEGTVSQISQEAGHITESEGDIPSCQTGSALDEAEGRTYPEEIKNFVERARSLPVPKKYVTYWLNSIHSHVVIPENDGKQRGEKKTSGEEGSGSVQGTTRNRPFVILVGTHSDKIPKHLLDQRKKLYFDEIRKVLMKSPLRFDLADEDFAISNLGSDPNINALKSKIFEIAQKQVYWGEKIPARWIPLERALMELKNSGIQVMDTADVNSLNENLEVGIARTEELDLFLRFEHDMGNIVFFNTERLRKKVVLNPEWLIYGVKIWITSDQVINRHPELSAQWFAFKNTGRLTSTLIDKLWSPNSEIHQHKGHLLDVMEKLNIIVKPLQKDEEEEEYYWVPCMVSMPAPDDLKKPQQNKDTNNTSTLCFRPKTNFIPVGVFHRLLATCLSKWAPAKEGDTYHLFQGLSVFDLDLQQQLLLSLNDSVIQATVIRFTKKGQIPDLTLCMTIRDELYTALSEILECLCPGSELEIYIKCKESSPLTNEGMHSITTLRTIDELKCSTHKEAHCVESVKLLEFWEEHKKQIPASVLPQHSALARERFTRLSSLVLDVGSKVLRKVLVYYTTTSGCTLDQYMKNNRPNILNLQQQKKPVLTQDQVHVIFPQSGQTDIDEYDITLASALLNNIYPSLGHQEKQIITDLRTERNKLAHSPSTKMSEQDFQTKWTEITTILTDLSKLCKDPNFDNKVQKEIQDIQQSGSFAILSNLPAITEELKKVCTLLKEIGTT